MIGVDTNVLVRYITADDPKQFSLAKNLLENKCSKENPGVVNLIVLCELV
jgi:predicted nucleic-acid-binding protein